MALSSPEAPVPLAPAKGAHVALGLRVVATGAAIGIVLALSNLYMGLKTGLSDSGNITASVLGFALLAAWARLGATRPSMEDTNLIQTIAAPAGGVVVSSGLVTAIPSLAMLGHHYATTSLVLWAVSLALLGTMLAWSMHRRLFADENLPFPTSVATAEVIRSMHAAASNGLARARSLSLAAVGAMLVTWFRDGKPSWIPQTTLLPGRLRGVPAAALTLGVSYSPMMIGAGLLIGPNLGVSILIGSTVAWAVLAPRLVVRGVVATAEYDALVQWLMWPGIGLMLASAFTAFVLDGRALYRALRALLRRSAEQRSDALGGWLLPLWALALVGTGLVGRLAFALPTTIIVLALVLALVLGSIAVRACGETDVNAFGIMATVTQISTRIVARGTAAVPLAAGGLVGGVASQAGDAVWALKAGHLLGFDPRRQLRALIIGLGIGAAVAVPGYSLLDRAYRVGSERLPSPSALSWKATAEAVATGAAALPHEAATATAIAALIGVVLTLLAKTKQRAFVPSPFAIGIGAFIPAYYGATIFLGAMIAALFRWRWRSSFEHHAATVAAGAIAGESLVGVLVAVLVLAGVLQQ